METMVNQLVAAVAELKTQAVETEKKNVEQIAKLQNEVRALVTKEGEVEKRMGKLDYQMGEMKNQLKKIETKTEKIDINVMVSLVPGWTYQGRGVYGTKVDYINKYPTALPQCAKWCEKKRKTGGSGWNGFHWRNDGFCECVKGDRGHTAQPDMVHFRVE